MLPARTICPPYIFTPRRRPAASRLLLDDPPAFSSAMVLLRCSVFCRDSAANAHHFLLCLVFVRGFGRRRLVCPFPGRLRFGGFRSTGLRGSSRLNFGRGRR